MMDPEKLEFQLNAAFSCIRTSFEKAMEKHPRFFASTHEGYAVLKEEIDELWDDIKRDMVAHSLIEVSQVGAMAVKYMISIWNQDEPFEKEGEK